MGSGKRGAGKWKGVAPRRGIAHAKRAASALLLLGTLLLPAAALADDGGHAGVIARLDELWQARASSEAIRELIEGGRRALEGDPRNYEILWRVARAHWWLANTQENRTVKKALAVKAMEWAARALEMDGNRVESHYTYAISVGEYATCIGITSAIMENVAGKFEGSMMKSYEMDPDIDNGGPMTALGRFYFVLPWPKRDLAQSRRFLEQLKERHPNALLGRVYLAETYYEIGEKDRARAELEFVRDAEPSPNTWPELPKPKPIAQQRLAEWFA